MKTIYTYIYKDGKIDRKETLVNETERLYRVAKRSEYLPGTFGRQIAKSELPKIEEHNYEMSYTTDSQKDADIVIQAFRNRMIEMYARAKIEADKMLEKLEEFEKAVRI